MNTLLLNKGVKIIYDLESKIIGRHPTDSNLLEFGSDNSLYMGLNNNIDSVELICQIMNLNSIDEFNSKSIMMNFYGESVEVQCNINHDGHLQYKIVGNGKMFELLTKYEKINGPVNQNKLLIMMDFSNNEIYFEESEEEFINNSSNKNKANKELEDILEESKTISKPNTDVDAYIETKLSVRNNYVQRTFRNNLLVEFDGKCALCAVNKKELLRASHIIPYSECSTVNEMIDYNNGLLLCVNHDKLFDTGYISFDKETGNIMISNKVEESLYQPLNINSNMKLSKKYLTNKRVKYLNEHKLK